MSGEETMALRCTKSLAVYVNGSPRVVQAGQLVQDDDPILQGRATCFESVDAHLAARRPRVEQATADPGQPRDLTPPTPVTKDDGNSKPTPRRGRGSSK
ncbi:hypothetical protein KBY55_09580 [Streptomyces sp. b94]|uniref:hypothetical protein n=1 Tax=Streptomyces sp. b94 TaxID=1827634 RepID=UPI001B372294|nr:hypothetical protein [Streptomyces sp. b94]MBQ1096334.1 hypothetical protein [Streptomyces sp. b94]